MAKLYLILKYYAWEFKYYALEPTKVFCTDHCYDILCAIFALLFLHFGILFLLKGTILSSIFGLISLLNGLCLLTITLIQSLKSPH